MNKRIIIGLVLLMGISLLGIISVQFYWFYNSVKIRNELFDRSVNEAINIAVRRLETRHDLKIIRGFTTADSSKWGGNIPPPPPPLIQEIENIDVMVKKDSINGRITVITTNSARARSASHSFKVQALQKKPHHPAGISGDTTIAFSDSLITTGIAGTGKMGMKIEQLEKLTKQIAIEYKGWKGGRHIDEKQLKNFISEELNDRAIPIGFNYVIYPDDSLSQKTYPSAGPIRWYKVNLFPNDIFRKNLVLAVSFPERNPFIGRATTLLLGLSTIFTLIIFITFALSIFLIIRQKKISEMKSDFINNMTHEFKTPISTISIAADSISNDKVIKDEVKVRFFAGMIKKENRRMNEQVERILQIARLERKEFEFSFQPVNVHELIGEAIEGILLQVEKKGGRIDKKLEAMNPVVTTDPIHFLNLVYNLLDNANKYSPDVPLITVTTTNNSRGLLLSVEDRGIGMSKGIQAKIFDKFYRLPSGNVHNVKGFGLGLSYVKAILEANQGTIRVYSEPGKGSRFVVFIPFLISK
jgi:two-component system phosphate regulon sensor histidine kinase PhoR